MMRQYWELKSRYEDCLLFFRLGDFYEMFFDDAEKGSRLLGLTLTARDSGGDAKAPMCGVPYHSAQQYIAKLLEMGEKVAICEQMEDPKKAKKLVRREVVRVLTPGTVVESSLLDEKSNNYLAALAHSGGETGLALLDLSTGDFRATFAGQGASVSDLRDEIARIRPAECLASEQLIQSLGLSAFNCAPIKEPLSGADARKLLLDHFGVLSLEPFGCEDNPGVQAAAAELVGYAKRASGARLEHLNRLQTFEIGASLRLDPFTLSALEIVDPPGGSRAGPTLLSTLDLSCSAAGARTLRQWLVRPLAEAGEILNRLDAVQWLVENSDSRRGLRDSVSKVADLERICARVGSRTANARDLVAMRTTLLKVRELRDMLKKDGAAGIVGEHAERLDEIPPLRAKLDSALADEPPFQLNEAGLIKDGYNAEVDELRNLARHGKEVLLGIQRRERERTGIETLKVHYNSVFGYFIEISRAKAHMAPADYERKQTLTNSERFITPELKELEAKILGAQDRLCVLERDLFAGIREEVAGHLPSLLATARSLAALDCLACLAEAAARFGYVRPAIDPSGMTEIIEGRHPVLERIQETFVSNDVRLIPWQEQVLIITGPNMAGKSTFLRQTALITLMAHAGSFVPAKQAKISVADGIFCRIGAADRLTRGQSTFMVEMTEAAHIINHATERSLLIFDEIGRGTSTFDGIAIASALVEHIVKEIGAKTLFATHYYELTALADSFSQVRNFNVLVREWKGELVFLYKIISGRTDRSYGVQVAKLAGLPKDLIEKAREYLREFERQSAARQTSDPGAQLNLFGPLPDPVRAKLMEADLETLTPLEALNLLHALREMLNAGDVNDERFSDA